MSLLLDAPTPIDRRNERTILAAMCIALVAVIASVSGLGVAQQEMTIDLGATQSGVLWIINGYTLALAALLMPVGAIGDRWGRRTVLLVGLVVFALSNVAALVADTTAQMLAARVVAGIGAAMVMPVTLSVITSTFPAEDRARAVGVWAGFAGSGGMLGMFYSAFAVDALTWRWAFVLPIVLVAIALVMTLRAVPNTREHSVHRFDTAGAVLSALAIGGVVLGIHEGPERGWSDIITVTGLVVGVVAGVAFVAYERRHPAPLLDVREFSDRSLASGTFTITAIFTVMFGIFLVIFPFLVGVVGMSALRSAAGLLPMAAVMMPASTVAPRIAVRIGQRTTMLTGAVVFTLGLVLLATFASVDGGYLSILPGLVVIGLGAGTAMAPATTAITEALPDDKQGVASALNDTSRELGGAIGMALLGSVLNAAFRGNLTDRLADLPAAVVQPAGEGLFNALGVAQQSGAELGPRIAATARASFVDAWVTSMWVGVAVATLAVVYLVVRGPRRPADPAPQ